MANFNPVLFGKPSFGSQDRDAWLECLLLFLGDPFRPIGGKYAFTVPGDAITGEVPGSAIWRNNSYGIRELNEFSESNYINDGDTMEISNRPGVLFVYCETDILEAIYFLKGNTYAASGSELVHGNNTYWTTNAPLAGYIACYHNGTSAWVLDNQTGNQVKLYMCIVSLGEQVTS